MPFARTVSMRPVCSVRPIRYRITKPALLVGEPVTMLTTLIASVVGRLKRKIPVLFVKKPGTQLKQQKSDIKAPFKL